MGLPCRAEVNALSQTSDHFSHGFDVKKIYLTRMAGSSSNVIGLTGELLYVKDVDYDTSGILSAACDLDCVIAQSTDLPEAVVKQFTCYSLGTERDPQLPKQLPHETCKLPMAPRRALYKVA